MKPVKMIVAFAALLVSVALGLSVLLTPPAAPQDAPAAQFSALRAAEVIRAISKDVHTNADAEAIAAVRAFLVNELQDIGLDVQLRTYEKDYPDGSHCTAVDICGVLRGSAEKSLLLVAHYDSNPGLAPGRAQGSHGASDDGYGVAVILETLRCLKARGPLQNTVRVVFTDAEETTMLGSEAIAKDTAYNAAASLAVFNIESRGLRGPAILFEASKNNAALLRFYAENNPAPASWSMATDVYRVMPNRTDFTAFMNAGMQGLNFSNLYCIDDNHTPRDAYENISLSAVQGYGEQVLPLVVAFAEGRAPDTFRSDSDMSWFTLMKGVLVSFPSWMNWAWLGLAALLLAAYVLAARARGALKPGRLWFAAALLGISLGVAAAGTGVAYLLALIFNRPFLLMGLTGIPGFAWIAIACAALVLALFLLLFRGRLKKGWTQEELTAAPALLSLVFAAAFTILLPGGAFLLSFAVIFACLFGLLALAWRPFGLFTGFAACWVAAPVAALLLVSLTTGSLGIVLLFACFPLMFPAAGIAGVMMEPCPLRRQESGGAHRVGRGARGKSPIG